VSNSVIVSPKVVFGLVLPGDFIGRPVLSAAAVLVFVATGSDVLADLTAGEEDDVDEEAVVGRSNAFLRRSASEVSCLLLLFLTFPFVCTTAEFGLGLPAIGTLAVIGFAFPVLSPVIEGFPLALAELAAAATGLEVVGFLLEEVSP
jgi:hypothetical protein